MGVKRGLDKNWGQQPALSVCVCVCGGEGGGGRGLGGEEA